MRRTTDLTPTQIRVLYVFCSGDLTLPEAAALLGMAQKTVKIHLAAIYRKLRVRSRAGMVAEAFQRGLVHVPQTQKKPPRPEGRGGTDA